MAPGSHSYERSVKSATKYKLAPPKSKHVDHILQATRAGDAGVAEVFRTLQFRLRDSTWTISFKALIVVHMMIREGQPEVTLQYLAQEYRKVMTFGNFSDVQTQGKNIRCYSTYLVERGRSYGKTKQDYVEGASGRLKRLPVDKGLLRETESVQEVINSLVKCDFFDNEPENDITVMAFRLVILDLLKLFQVMNEATINVLEHYFEMSRPDAERALAIYKTFALLTERVMKFLSEARTYEAATRIAVPKLKHAPTSLATHLEEYLNDPDFDGNRENYLASADAKRTGKPLPNRPEKSSASASTKPAFPDPSPSQAAKSQQSSAKGPSLEMMDFFASIDQNQQPMAQNSAEFQQQSFVPQFATSTHQPQQQVAPQQTGFTGLQQQPLGQQSTNPFNQYQQQTFAPQANGQQQIPQQATGAGFGGFGLQPQVQTGFEQTNGLSQQPLQQPQQQFTGQPQQSLQQLQRQSTNPFRQSMMPQATGQLNNQVQSPPPPMPQMPQRTGTNPFTQQPHSTIGSQGFQDFMSHSQMSSTYPQQQQTQPQIMEPQSPPQPMMPQRTGTNPFARASPANSGSPSQPPGALVAQATGSTNPFRQASFVNQQTGTGWQTQQGTMGGLENLETKPVFPRPGQQQNPGTWN